MGLTFTDKEHCTDDITGQSFLLNLTADTGMVPVDAHLELMRQWIVERYAAAGLTLTGILTTPVVLGDVNLSAFGTAVDIAVTSLFGAYVNHTDNGGNWQGKDYFAPLWTELDILTTIGAPSRLYSHTANCLLSAAWCRQVYAILNMLAWITKTANYWEDPAINAQQWYEPYGSYPDGSTVVIAVDNAQAHIHYAPPGYHTENMVSMYSVVNKSGSLFRGYVRAFYEREHFTGLCNIFRNCDLYAYGSNTFFIPADAGIRAGAEEIMWDSAGRGYVENKWNKVSTWSGGNTTEEFSGYLGSLTDPVPAYPSTPVYKTIRGWWIGNFNGVFKFNVPGGFKFQ